MAPVSEPASWREKRERILVLYGHACTYCGANNCKLNIHHRYYEAGKAIWDYPDETLDCLCDRCHGHADELRRRLARASGFLDVAQAERVIGYMEALVAKEFALMARSVGASSSCRAHCEFYQGVADAFEISEDAVLDLATTFEDKIPAIELTLSSQERTS